MLEDFRSRMGDLRQEMERLANQAEELERVVREQQDRLEEMELLIRQRDEQLAEQQARMEELETTLAEREEELANLRGQAAEQEQELTRKSKELADLREQLAQREATETVLREQLAQAEARLAEQPEPVEETVPQILLNRFAVLEELVRRHGDSLAQVHTLIEREMGRLHGRLDAMEEVLARVSVPRPVEALVPPEEVALVEAEASVEEAPPVEVEAPSEELLLVEVEVPAEELPPVEVEVPAEELPLVEVEAPAEELPLVEVEAPVEERAAPPVELVPPEDPLQAILYESMELLPEATLIGLAGQDGLRVGVMFREDVETDEALEIELADLAVEAQQVVDALGTGPLLTVGFRAAGKQYLLSPVDYQSFAFLLAPTDPTDDLLRAQAVLLHTAARLRDFI